MLNNIRVLRAFFMISISATSCSMSQVAFSQNLAEVETLKDDGDIVVTARRQAERLQDVPIAVTAVSQAALDSRGFDSVTDIQQVTPNLNFTPGQGGNSGGIAAFIRGVGENDFIITSDPAVGVYIDGVYVARTFGATTELLGVDRIEVLRGPQGSLFGKNTIGGAINVVSHVPDGRQVIQADLRYGSYNTVRARMNMESALTDKLSVGFSALREIGEGWQKIPSGDNLSNKNVTAGRVILHYDDDAFDAVLMVDGLRRRQNSVAHSMLSFVQTPLSDLQNAFLGQCCTPFDRIDRTDSTPELNHDNTDSANVALTLTHDLGAGSIKSITAYRWVNALFGRDGDASSAVNYAGTLNKESARQFSQELQYLTPLFGDRGNILLGAYYFQERTRDANLLVVADGLYPALIAAGFDSALATSLDLNVDFSNRQKTVNYAVFGNFTYDLTDALTLELGGRYTYEKKRFGQRSLRIYSQQPLIPGMGDYTLSDHWGAFSPRVSLSYEIRPNMLSYVSFSRGFRSGGFNGRPSVAAEIGSYNPEQLNAYEAGLKMGFGKIATLNVAAFRNDYRDQQLLVSSDGGAGIPVVTIQNAGKSRIQGVELELDVRITPNLRMSGSLGFLDAKYLEYKSGGVDLSFRRPKQAPDITGNLSLAYTLPISDNLYATLRADATYRSETFIDVENSPLRSPDYALLNLSAEFDLPWRGTSLRFAADNITGKQVLVAGYDSSTIFGFKEGFFNDPRRYSVTFSIRR